MPTTDSIPAERVRLQVEMTKERLKSVDTLAELTGMASRKEFLDNALTLMAWAIRERQKGRMIASVSQDQESFTELMMPCFELSSNEAERSPEKS
jgi:hypothetical protein